MPESTPIEVTAAPVVETPAIPVPAAPVTQIKIREFSRAQIRQMHQALTALDGYPADPAPTPEGTQQPAPKLIPYKFGRVNEAGVPDPVRAAKVRSQIVKNLRVLGSHDKHLTKASDSLLNQISGGTGTVLQSDPEFAAKLTQYNLGVATLSEEVIEVTGLLTISVEDLNLGVNDRLHMTTVAALDPLLVD